MVEIVRISENAVHGEDFQIDRPCGHPVYLLLLVKTKARFEVDGEWVETPPDTAVLFQPGQKHRYCACGEQYQNNWMHMVSHTSPVGGHFPLGRPVLMHQAGEYYELFHLIYNEYYRSAPHRELILNNLTMALLDKLSDESNTSTYPDIYYELAKLREQIYRYPAEQWTTEEMSARLHISTGYLHSLYRRYFGTTCMQDVIQSRVKYAGELLLFHCMSIEEIADLCGYHSTEHFIRQFKAITGITPGRYRDRLR